MRNKNTIFLILLVLALLGLGYYLLVMKPASEAVDSDYGNMREQEKMNGEEKGDTNKISTSLANLLSQGKTLKCSWNGEVDGNTFGGTTYVSGKKFAGTYEYSVDGQTIQSNMVGDGTNIFMWSNYGGNKYGFKMDYSTMEDTTATETSTTTDDTTTPSADTSAYLQNYDYDCNNWSEDTAVFELPTDVEFVDQTKMVTDMMENIEDYKNLIPQE